MNEGKEAVFGILRRRRNHATCRRLSYKRQAANPPNHMEWLGSGLQLRFPAYRQNRLQVETILEAILKVRIYFVILG